MRYSLADSAKSRAAKDDRKSRLMSSHPALAPFPEVERIVERLIDGVSAILADQLVGVYLYGSLITGDFDLRVSDIDLVVVMTRELDDNQFAALHALHGAVVTSWPAWDNRLELAYISAEGLRNFQTRASNIGIISPGEPFHRIEAGADWLISWYALRQDGVALHGPPIQSLIAPMPVSAYLDAVRDHIAHYRHSAEKPHGMPALAYIVLTVARGLYTLVHGAPTSKVKAAAWAARRYPRWAPLLQRALGWRLDPDVDAPEVDEVRPQVRAYVSDMLAQIDEECCE